MSRDKEKQVDMTYLDIEKANERLMFHRDYMAHATRWTHIEGVVRDGDRLLDIGCGKLAPLAKVLYTNRHTSVKYLGVDYGKIKPDIKFGASFSPIFWEEQDASKLNKRFVHDTLGGAPTIVTSFEMFEHMQPDRAVEILINLREICDSDTTLYFSTPVFNGKAAKNHINEFGQKSFETMLTGLGFTIDNMWGTFASQRDYKPLIQARYGQAGVDLFEAHKEYFNADLVSNLWAPLFPRQSRNIMWRLKLSESFDAFVDETSWSTLSQDKEQVGYYSQSQDSAAWSRANSLIRNWQFGEG